MNLVDFAVAFLAALIGWFAILGVLAAWDGGVTVGALMAHRPLACATQQTVSAAEPVPHLRSSVCICG